MPDGYELAERIRMKVDVFRSEHALNDVAVLRLELHPDDVAILKETFRPPHEASTIFGVPYEITSRAPRGGRIKPPTIQGG